MTPVKANGPSLQYDFTGLHNLVSLLDSAGKYVVKVGIFGNKNSRSGAKGLKARTVTTNAELGLVHEFGSKTRKIPARSFLRMPLSMKSKEITRDALIGAAPLIAAGNIKAVLVNLGHACEKWIQNAFASRGFGSWPEDKPSTIRRKGSDSPLIDTAQLRRSIASKVESR